MTATAGLILAAGEGRRFGGRKLLAHLDGQPILQHVLELAHAARLDPVVVVLGSDAEALEASCAWRGETRIVNERPQDGLSSSVRRGLASLAGSDARQALVLLGDQPRLSLAQVEVVLGAATDEARPMVVPRYGGTPGNPVLLERAAWPLADALAGDAGMSQLFRARPELVRFVDVPGANPDVDTVGDLHALEARP
jgi:CTP:molybdopterin cytidylyltransferase MocA